MSKYLNLYIGLICFSTCSFSSTIDYVFTITSAKNLKYYEKLIEMNAKNGTKIYLNCKSHQMSIVPSGLKKTFTSKIHYKSESDKKKGTCRIISEAALNSSENSPIQFTLSRDGFLEKVKIFDI